MYKYLSPIVLSLEIPAKCMETFASMNSYVAGWIDRQNGWGLLVKTLYFIQGKRNKNIKCKNNSYKHKTQFLANDKKQKYSFNQTPQ